MERNQTIGIAVIVIVVASLGIIAVWNPIPAPDVRIGYLNKDLHQLALQVAVKNGLFEREGLNIQLEEFGNGGYVMDAFLAGEIDMGYLGVAPALVKRLNQDIDITILAAVNMEGSAIMVLKSEYDAGHVTTIADLVGKEVLHPGPATVQNFLLRLALNQSGLSMANITAASAIPAAMADSLTPSTPAFIAWEPFNALAQYEGKAVPLVLSSEIWPRHPCCVLASDNTFMANNPELVQQVVDIHAEAETWIIANPDEAIAIAMEWLEMDLEPVTNAFNNIIFDYNLNRTGIEMYLNFLIDEDIIITEKIPADTSAFLDSFLNTTYVDNLLLCC
ncbi:MAG: ABC transporter substrate-binding protein [Candidatus Thorarchaeota archaeon]|nr:ABC transporter substrate-binding protein [Candidatus Thorarchaeota archaeon]